MLGDNITLYFTQWLGLGCIHLVYVCGGKWEAHCNLSKIIKHFKATVHLLYSH